MGEWEVRLYRSLRGNRTSLYTFRCQLKVLKAGDTQLQTRGPQEEDGGFCLLRLSNNIQKSGVHRTCRECS
jgi:hypothetical protein